MAMTQAESYADLWAAHRDRAGPLTPDDVYGLADDRHFQPPSKAHAKRLARLRPYTTPLVLGPTPDVTRRRQINEALAYGNAVTRLHRPNLFLKAEPLPYVRPAPIAPDAPRVAADHMERRNAQLFVEAQRLAAYGMIAKGPLFHMSDAQRAYRSIK